MHGSDILVIFQKSTYWLDWPFPVIAALQNGSQDLFFSLLYFNFQLLSNDVLAKQNVVKNVLPEEAIGEFGHTTWSVTNGT